MIIHSFDNETEPIVTLRAFYGEQKHLCDVCIMTFSEQIYRNILAAFPCERLAAIGSCGGETPIYAFPYEGRKIAFFKSGIGATVAATDVLEANWLTGAHTFIMFGSAGALNSAETAGKYVVPTEAYRDEGISYHYAPPADYIRISGADTVAEVLREIGAPYVMGRVWTTDAIYRETRGQVRRRTEEGCLAVEMELAGVQAVCDFHGLRLYNFLVTGDILDEPEYRVADLHDANHSMNKFRVALAIARRV